MLETILPHAIESLDGGGEADATAPVAGPEASEPWSLDDTAPPGDWEEFGRSTNETYKWPGGNVDRYTEFVSYRGTGGFTGMTPALGYLNNGDAVGFVLGSHEHRDPNGRCSARPSLRAPDGTPTDNRA